MKVSRGASGMEMSGRIGGRGLELLNQSNYKVWRRCMESYLVGEDLWDVVNGNNTDAPENTPENAEATKKWRQVNAKAEFVLKTSISPALFDHIIGCKSAREIWETLNRLFNKKDEARLQILENELANTTQGNLSISEYFLKIKKLCSEISLLNPEEAISEARQRRYITQNTSHIQGWSQQPSLEEFENLLAKQMAGITIKEGEGAACGHHVTGDEIKFTKFHKYNGNDAIITADNTMHPVKKEGVIVVKLILIRAEVTRAN